MKIIVTVIIGVVALLLVYSLFFRGVDRTRPEAVAAAFVDALRVQKLSRAADLVVPDDAEAWRKAATQKLSEMGTGTLTRFLEDLAVNTAFVAMARDPAAPANEAAYTAGSIRVDLRQIDGRWYVTKGPL